MLSLSHALSLFLSLFISLDTFLLCLLFCCVACAVSAPSKTASSKNASKQAVVASRLELCIGKLERTKETTADEDDEGGEGVFVELAALPPLGVTRGAGEGGLEGTFFKTQVAAQPSSSSCFDFQKHRVAISPLPHSDGFLQVSCGFCCEATCALVHFALTD